MQKKREEAKRLFAEGKSANQVAAATGVSRYTAQQWRKEFAVAPGEAGESKEWAEGSDSAELCSKSYTIDTLDKALKHGKVDLKKWEVDRHIVNSWQVCLKVNDKPVTKTLYQVKVFLRRKTPSVAQDVVAGLVEQMKKHSPKAKPVTRSKGQGEPCLLEVDIADPHFGKLCWGEETGTDYDAKIARELYLEAVDTLLERGRKWNVEKILFPVGNDLMHVDAEQATTKGTRQDQDGRWPKIFADTYAVLVEAIDKLRAVAPVEIVVIPGNHDRRSTLAMGFVLAAHYHNDPEVDVNNSPRLRKCVTYGPGMIMFTHGDTVNKPEALANIMAAEWPEEWARAKHRACRIGHFHKKKETKVNTADTLRGTSITVLGSFSGTDAWHYEQGYINSPRTAEAFLWGRKSGPIASVQYNAG